MYDCVLYNMYLTNNNMGMNQLKIINIRTVVSKDVMPCNVVERCHSIFCDTHWRHQMPLDSWYLSTRLHGASSMGIITITYHINHGVHCFNADCKENKLAPETRRLHQQYPCCKRDEGTCG